MLNVQSFEYLKCSARHVFLLLHISYLGLEPMGLFWSMTACPNHKYGTRYMKNDLSKPLVITITVHKGHLDSSACRQDKDYIASKTVERWYMSKTVERVEVHHGRVRGSLLKPKGKTTAVLIRYSMKIIALTLSNNQKQKCLSEKSEIYLWKLNYPQR